MWVQETYNNIRVGRLRGNPITLRLLIAFLRTLVFAIG